MPHQKTDILLEVMKAENVSSDRAKVLYDWILPDESSDVPGNEIANALSSFKLVFNSDSRLSSDSFNSWSLFFPSGLQVCNCFSRHLFKYANFFVQVLPNSILNVLADNKCGHSRLR